MAFPKISNMTALVGNTLWSLNGQFQFDFDVTPNSVLEVLQNVYEIFATPLGSQVLLEQYGQDTSWIDQPGNIGELQMQTSFLIACSLWEPRAKFLHISFGLDTTDVIAGKYYLNLELEIDLSVAVQKALFAPPVAANIWVVDANFAGSAPVVQQESLTL